MPTQYMVVPPELSGPLDRTNFEGFLHHTEQSRVPCGIGTNLAVVSLTVVSALLAGPDLVGQFPDGFGKPMRLFLRPLHEVVYEAYRRFGTYAGKPRKLLGQFIDNRHGRSGGRS